MHTALVVTIAIWFLVLEAASHITLQATTMLRVMTYNVRYDSMPDTISIQETINTLPKGLPKGPQHYYNDISERPWSTRRIHVANDILERNIDILGKNLT